MKNLERQASNIEYFKKRLNASYVKEEENLKILVGDNVGARKDSYPIHLLIWQGSQKDPYVNYIYPNWDKAQERINLSIERNKAIREAKEKQRAEKLAFVPKFEVGDIFVASWGYEQINIDCYQVVEKISTHYAILRKIGYERVEGSEGHDCEYVVPIKDSFVGDETYRRKVTKWGIKISEVRFACKHSEGETHYRSWYY